jgi:parallel beta-helix repeat protein
MKSRTNLKIIGLFLVSLLAINFFVVSVFPAGETCGPGIGACGCGDRLGDSYTLTEDLLNCPDYGIFLTKSNIVFDCDGHRIIGASFDYSGVQATNGVHSATIKNCIIERFQYGIYVDESDYVTVENNTLSDNDNGIWFYDTNNATIIDNYVYSNFEIGIRMTYAEDSVIENNVIDDSGTYGIHLYIDTVNNTMINNNISNSKSHGIFSVQNNDLNHILDNNIWENEGKGIYCVSAGCTIDSNYVCFNTDHDIYHSISDNPGDNNRCDATVQWEDDGLPSWSGCTYSCYECWCDSCESCQTTINNERCNFHSIDGIEAATYGIILNQGKHNNVIKNCVVSDFWAGISIWDASSNNTLVNNTAFNNVKGLMLTSGPFNNTIKDNTVYDNDYGIQIYDSDSNIIENNNATYNTINGVYFYSTSNDNVLNNNLVCDNTLDINDLDSNSGENNACTFTNNWDDIGTTNCTYDCGLACFGVPASSQDVCSGHGTCIASDTCLCDGYWTGIDCSTKPNLFGDLNDDCIINILDLVLIAKNYGSTC